SGTGQLASVQTAAPSFGIEVRPVDAREAAEIARNVSTFAQEPNGAMLVTAGALTTVHRDAIVKLASEYRLPAVYPQRSFAGGLISYGPDVIKLYRDAAGYVDRILKGEQPSELPVQQPVKFELVINLKTAKTIGIAVPATLLARADEVIE